MLTHEQIEDFNRDGVICLRQLLSADDVNGLRQSVQLQLNGLGKSGTGYDFEEIARQIWSKVSELDTGAANRFDMSLMKSNVLEDKSAKPLLEDNMHEDEGLFFYDVASWKKSHEVRKVAFDSHLPEVVAQLLDANYLNFWEDTTFVKAPRTRQKTAFHQDLAYFQIKGDQCVIVWIPLDKANAENGVLEYVRGSHRWGQIFAPNVFVSQTPFATSPEERCPDIEGKRESYDIISFDVEPGDVIIHHVRTVHGAGGNMSADWRRAVSFRYCGDDVRYFDRPGAIPQVGINHDLQTGDRLITSDYPIVWPKPWPEAKLSDMYNLYFDRQGNSQHAG